MKNNVTHSVEIYLKKSVLISNPLVFQYFFSKAKVRKNYVDNIFGPNFYAVLADIFMLIFIHSSKELELIKFDSLQGNKKENKKDEQGCLAHLWIGQIFRAMFTFIVSQVSLNMLPNIF